MLAARSPQPREADVCAAAERERAERQAAYRAAKERETEQLAIESRAPARLEEGKRLAEGFSTSGRVEFRALLPNVGKMLTCLAKISLPACGRRCGLELKKLFVGVQSGVQAILRAVRRFSSDFVAFLVVFPRFSPDIGRRCAGSLVRGHRGRLPTA